MLPTLNDGVVSLYDNNLNLIFFTQQERIALLKSEYTSPITLHATSNGKIVES
jgi:hypothetical protein